MLRSCPSRLTGCAKRLRSPDSSARFVSRAPTSCVSSSTPTWVNWRRPSTPAGSSCVPGKRRSCSILGTKAAAACAVPARSRSSSSPAPGKRSSAGRWSKSISAAVRMLVMRMFVTIQRLLRTKDLFQHPGREFLRSALAVDAAVLEAKNMMGVAMDDR